MGVAGAGAAISARDKRDRAERQLVLAEQEGARLSTKERERLDVAAANGTMTLIDNAGFLNDTKTRIDGKKLAAGLEAGDAQARSVALGIARSNRLIDPSVKDARWVKGPNDGWVIQTSNEDGSFGVITLDGSSDPDSPVASFKTLEDFVNVTNEALANTLKYQTKFDNSAALAAEGIVTADYAGLEDAIAGLPQEQQVATKRGVIATAANIDDPAEKQKFIDSVASGEPPAESETPAPEITMTPDEEPTQATRQVRGPLALMGEQEQRGLDARKEGRIKKAPEELVKEKKRLANLEGKTGRLAISARQVSQGKIARLENEIAELEPATFAMNTPEQQASVDKVVEQTKDMPTDQVVEKVMSGEITVSPEEQAVVATQLQQAGVQTVNDLANLENRRDRAMARVAMIAAIGGGKNPDRANQRQMLAEINNIFETGTTSMSAKDATTAGIQKQNADTNLGRLMQAIKAQDFTDAAAASTIGGDLVEAFNKERDEDGVLDPQAVERFMPSLTQFFVEAAPFYKKNPSAAKYAMDALKPIASQILAVYAAEEEGGLSETWNSLFRGDATGENIDTTDFDLDRVNGKFNSKGEIIGFTYTDAYGETLDEMVEPRVLKDLNENVYRILEIAVIAKNVPGQG